MPKTKLLIEMADDPFALDVEKLRLTPGGPQVFEDLLKAVAKLAEYDHYENFPQVYSSYGKSYTYKFHPGYFLIYEREIEELPGQPVKVTLKLCAIQAA